MRGLSAAVRDHRMRTDTRSNAGQRGSRAMTTKPYVIDELISAKSIAARVEELAREISVFYAGTDKLVVIGLLRGSFIFIADLVRELDLPVEVDFLEVSSYGDDTRSSREVRILKDLRGKIEGRDVLVVEDIVDTGHTLARVLDILRTRHPARTRGLRTARQAEPPGGGGEGDLDRLRDPRPVRGRVRHRLCAAQPEPAAYRGGSVRRVGWCGGRRGDGRHIMRGLWVRAARLLEQGWKPAGKWLENGLPLLPGRCGRLAAGPGAGKSRASAVR